MMRQVFAVASLALSRASTTCGEEKTCSGAGQCTSNDTHTGLKYGCVPAGVVGCSDKRFSCPESSDCDIIGYQCNSSHGGSSIPLITNQPAERPAVSSYDGLCSILDHDLPSFCKCKDYTYGGRLECDVNVLGLDTVGLALDLAICDGAGGGSGDNAHANIEVIESDLDIDFKIAGIASGVEKTVPIPGLSIGLPVVGNAGAQLAFAFGDSMDSLYVKLGLDLCAKVGPLKLCGSQLTKALPIWILNGRYQIPVNICHTPTPTPSPAPTPTPTPSPSPAPTPTPTPTPSPAPTPTPTPTPSPAPTPTPSPTPMWSSVGHSCETHSELGDCEYCAGIPMDDGHTISGGCKVIGGFELQPQTTGPWEAVADGNDECDSKEVKDVAACKDLVSRAQNANINVVSYWSPDACGSVSYAYVRFYHCNSMPTLDGENHGRVGSAFKTMQRGLSSQALV